MIHKNRCNRRYIRKKMMKRKYRILHERDLDYPTLIIGTLAKGKIHCSCNQCSWKSTKLRNCGDKGYTSYNSRNLYHVKDRRKFDRMDYGYYEDYVLEQKINLK